MGEGYDAIVKVYQKYWGPFSARRFLPLLEKQLLPHLPQGARILDLGCGTGDLARALCEKGYRLTGVDLSEEMVKTAREAAPRAEFVRDDMRVFKRPAAFHAVIVAFATVNHLLSVRDLRRVLGNAYESLLERGWLWFDFNTPAGLQARWQGTEAVIESDVVGISRGVYDERTKVARTVMTCFWPAGAAWARGDAEIVLRGFEKEEVREVLVAVGFKDIAMEALKGKVGQGRVFVLARK